MPLTELLVAVYVVCMMLRYTKQPATRGAVCINTTQTVIKDIVPVIAKLF